MFKGIHNTLPIAFAALVTSVSVSANDDLEAFFEKPENQEKFEIIKNSGQLEQARTQMVAECEANPEKAELDCTCLSENLAEVTDREFVFESIRAYETYQEKAAAMEAGDSEKLASIEEEEAQRTSVLEDIQSQCALTDSNSDSDSDADAS